jgi:hypothetical protein
MRAHFVRGLDPRDAMDIGNEYERTKQQLIKKIQAINKNISIKEETIGFGDGVPMPKIEISFVENKTTYSVDYYYDKLADNKNIFNVGWSRKSSNVLVYYTVEETIKQLERWMKL